MKRTLSSLLLGLLIASLVAIPVLAIDNPDDMDVVAVYVYEDCAEDGDVGVLVEYSIEYSSSNATANATATEAFLIIFLGTDNATQLASVAPYAFNDDGYGHGVAWIRFGAVQVPIHGLDIANKTQYTVRLTGNPTVPAGWAGDPPSTTGAIDYWQEGGDTSTILALQILHCAHTLEGEWGLDMIESTAIGNRLTTLGEAYFTSIIPSCRLMAPSAFSSSTIIPEDVNPEYETSFGATLINGTGTVVGSPITLVENENVVNVTAAGTFTLTLNNGTVGTVTNSTGVVTGSPVSCVAGTSTITVPTGGEGTLIVDVYLDTTASGIWSQTEGTAFDLSGLAVEFNMSATWLAGIVWFALTILICAATYEMARKNMPGGAGMGKIVFLMFNICFIGGTVLGLLPLVWELLLFLGCDLFIGYVLFFRPANV